MAMPSLTAVLRYRLSGERSAFSAAAQALAARVEAEGHPGVLGCRYFLGPAEAQAGAIVDYRDPASWIGHHQIITDWPEIAALRTAARLDEVVFHGDATPEMVTWMARMVPGATVLHGSVLVAGFARP